MKYFKKIIFFFVPVLLGVAVVNSSCRVSYSFKDVGTIPDSVKTVKVNGFDNRASYINPQLSPSLTDKLRQKIIRQTRLSPVTGDNADWEISGTVTDYSISTAAVSNSAAAASRLTVTVHITFNDRTKNKTDEFDATRTFDFTATQTLQQAEATLKDDIINNLTDEIFNHIFSNW